MERKRPVVDVSQKDIDRAIRNNSSRYVVATAVARAVPDATEIMVDMQTIRYSAGDHRYTYLTPRAAQQHIVDFDAGDEIRPFKFQLRAPQITLTASGRRRKAEKKDVAEGKDSHAQPRVERSGSTIVRVSNRPPPASKNPAGGSRYRSYGNRGLRINRERSAAS